MVIDINKINTLRFLKKTLIPSSLAGTGTGAYFLGKVNADNTELKNTEQNLEIEVNKNKDLESQLNLTVQNKDSKIEKLIFTIEQYEKQIKEINKEYRDLISNWTALVNKNKGLEKDLSKANLIKNAIISVVNKYTKYDWTKTAELKKALF